MTPLETTLDRVTAIIYDNMALDENVAPDQPLFYVAGRESSDQARARGEAGLDSLDRVEIGMAVESIFEIEIPDADYQSAEFNTAAGIAAYVDRRVAEKG